MECVSHKYSAMSVQTVIEQPGEPRITLMLFRYKHFYPHQSNAWRIIKRFFSSETEANASIATTIT